MRNMKKNWFAKMTSEKKTMMLQRKKNCLRTRLEKNCLTGIVPPIWLAHFLV